MQSSLENLPRVSFIMPTLNVEALLDNVLSSITRQTYPRDRYEILLADAHSTDRTREIAKKYGAIVIDDDGKNMEEGKRLALRHATGEYIVFVDADNEITHPDYIELAVKALAANPQALGVESYYLPSPKMSSFCAYLTHLLHISDPICWLMSANPKLVARDGEIERWTLPGGSLSYPLGANGFVFRRADLESVQADEQFQDTHVGAVSDEKRQTRVAAHPRARRASLLRPDALGVRAKTPPRHGAFFARAGGNAGELDEGKTARAALAGGGLLRHLRRPALAHVARPDPRPRLPLALAFAGVPRQRAGQRVGRVDLQNARQDKKLVAKLKPKQNLK